MLWCVQFQQLNVARKPRDEPRVGRRHDDWSLSDAHERFNGSPEASVLTQNNIHLQITHAYTRDVTKFELEFHSVRTLNALDRFKIL